MLLTSLAALLLIAVGLKQINESDIISVIRDNDIGRLRQLVVAAPDLDVTIVERRTIGQSLLSGSLEYRTTPLTEAVRLNRTEFVQALVDAGADPNFAPTGIEPPLSLALMAHSAGASVSYNYSMIETLLAGGADPLALGGRGFPAATQAIAPGLFPSFIEMVQYAISLHGWQEVCTAGEEWRERADGLQPGSMYVRYIEALQYICNDTDTVARAYRAICEGEVNALQQYMETTASISQNDSLAGWTLATWAAVNGRSECLEIVLAHNAAALLQTTEWGATALHCAVESRDSELVSSLLLPELLEFEDGLGRKPLDRAQDLQDPITAEILLRAMDK